MIQTHRCDICGDLATERHGDHYLCDKLSCVAALFILFTQGERGT